MLETLKRDWRQFRRSAPGQRFQRRYYHKRRSRRGLVGKIVVIATGALLFVAGIFLLAFPGPGTVLLVIAGSLIAEESLMVARALDWTEVRLRRLYGTIVGMWRKTSPATRVLIVICGLIVAASLAFGAYKITFA